MHTPEHSSTQLYGLLGHPLGHSFSRQFHNERFEQLGIDAHYENFDVDNIDTLPTLIQTHPNLRGLNVTIPYKQAVLPYLDAIDPVARRIGAVNVVKIEHLPDADHTQTRLPGIRLTGYNSDIIGFANSIRPLIDNSLKRIAQPANRPMQALLLGTGGASRAVHCALEDMGIVCHYVSRRADSGTYTYDQLSDQVMISHRIIVNCSPVGTYPHTDDCPAIPYEHITQAHLCFDLVYNPAETLFMKRAAAQGAITQCGYEMLVGQAIESYHIWQQ